MGLIDADALIKKYKEHKKLLCKNQIEFRMLSDKDKARVDELDNCIADVVNMPAIELEQKTGKWIPCSERLPEKYGWYMCTLKDYRVNTYYWNNKGEWVDNGKKHFFELYNISSRYTGKEITAEQEGSVYWTDWVIAWMPLPEPYTERQEK